MAVGVFAGQNVLATCKRIEILAVQQETRSEGTKAFARAAPPGKIEIFRQRVRFVPGMGNVWMRSCCHLRSSEGSVRQMRQGGVHRPTKNGQRPVIARERVRVAQPDVDLVEGVGGQRVTVVETGRHGGRETGDQPSHFLPGSFLARDGVGARQSGDVLPETVPGDEPVHVPRRVESGRRIVPAAKILPRRW